MTKEKKKEIIERVTAAYKEQAIIAMKINYNQAIDDAIEAFEKIYKSPMTTSGNLSGRTVAKLQSLKK